MNDYHDRLDEPHQGDDRPVAGWPGHNPDEQTGEHEHTDEHTDETTDENTGALTDEHTEDRTDEDTDETREDDETRDEDEPLVGEVWNNDATTETDGEHAETADVTEAERTEDTPGDHVAEPFGTEEPVIVDEPAAEETDTFVGPGAEPVATTGETDDFVGPSAEPVAVADPPETTDEADGYVGPGVVPVTETEPEAEAATGARPTDADDFDVEQLVAPEAAERLRERWRDVKAVFVDDPADAVQQAGALSGEAVDELTAALGRLREKLEGHTTGGEGADTEKLRVALRGYGSLIERILTR